MRNKFDEMLDTLNIELIKMGALCEEAITCAVKALLDKDNEMAEKTFRLEKSIDEKEREIESWCMKLLLRQQPVARDLRIISSALKMIGDMERI
ncbi:MAG: phosphate transport system regulatory protein PhoU, partial [Oscillospiraceae bacterium]|nr:phosphate transport system regulatory protein PhoU [Oscillospiraceae bacterium]